MAHTTMFVARYALSGGIKEAIGTITDDGQYLSEGGHGGFYRIDRDAFRTREEAVADAELRRAAKIASLRKQIAKLEKVRFD
jgi:hypothetical protein